MAWLWLFAIIAGLFFFASASRKRKQRAAVAGFRRHFPGIARMRLIAACPGLEGVLKDTELRLVFDWILIELYRRSGASGFGELMQWSIEKGELETQRLTADIARDAVDRLPRTVLAIIDQCEGRTVAAVLLDQALAEAGERIGPDLNRKHV